MKNGLKILLAVLAGIVMIITVCISMSNNTISLHEEVTKQKSYLAAAYQERSDLIPNLVKIVKAASEHETDVIKNVTDARAELNEAINSNNDDAMTQANDQLNKSISILVEAYPTITSNQNYLSLQDQLEGSENRIRVARNYYSDAISKYNSYIKRFPGRIIANMLDYEVIDYYKADTGSETAPDINFN